MANSRRETVGYRKLDLQNTLSEGLLPVARHGGDLERQVAAGLFRLADAAGAEADRAATRAGGLAGQLAALEGAPGPSTIIAQPTPEPLAVRTRDAVAYDLSAHLTDPARQPHLDGLDADFRNRLGKMIASAPDEIRGQIGLLSGYRSVQRQAQLYQNALKKYGSEKAARKWVAPPGRSQHNQGRAYDLRYASDAAKAWVHDNAERFGLYFPMGWEPWHIEPLGTRGTTWAGQDVPLEHRAPGVVQIEPGKPGRFQPSRRDTVFGRAYDAAGTRTYLQTLDVDMRRDMTAVYEQFKDDPAALRAGMDALLAMHLDPQEGQVFPEIAADYQVTFARQRMTWELEADRRAERRREEENRAAFIASTNVLETDLARRAAEIDPANPLGPAALADAQSAIDVHYDAAVARGIMGADDAETAKIRSRRQSALDFYRRQADPLSADDVAGMRRAMGADFRDGKLDGVDGPGWAALDAELLAIEADKRSGANAANAAYRARADRFLGRVSSGFDVDPGEWAQFEMDAATAPDGAAIRDLTTDQLTIARAMRGETLAASVERLQNLQSTLGRSPDDRDLVLFDFAIGQLDTKRTALLADPVSYGENVGTVSATGSLGSAADVDALSELIAQRVVNAGIVADRFGIAPRVFKPGEAAMLAEMIARDPAGGLAAVQAITEGAGAGAHDVLTELSDTAPTLAHALGTAVATGDMSIAVDVARAGQMRQEKVFTAKMPPESRFAVATRPVVGDALAELPRVRKALIATAMDLFETRANAEGFDPADIDTEGSRAQAAWATALDRAAGGRTIGGIKFGGFAEVNDGMILAPAHMPTDRVGRLWSQLDDAALDALPPLGTMNGIAITAAQVRSGRLVTVGDGRYAVALGEPGTEDAEYLTDVDGAFWIVDIYALQRVTKLPVLEDGPLHRLSPISRAERAGAAAGAAITPGGGVP